MRFCRVHLSKLSQIEYWLDEMSLKLTVDTVTGDFSIESLALFKD